MNNLQKHSKTIVAVALLIAGVIFILAFNKPEIQFGVGFLCFALAVLMLTWIGVAKQKQDLMGFDTEANDILKDISEKGDKSPYYQFYNVQILNKLRAKMIKKQRKQLYATALMGVILIVFAIFSMVG